MNSIVRTLEDEYTKLDSLLDSMCYKNETGQEVDMVVWYDTIAQMEAIQKELAVWKRMPAEYLDAIDRADALIDKLHCILQDPFDASDSQPEVEPEYDPADEWFHMTESMRRGE